MVVQIESARHLNYKSFRLHDPERYVIDLEKPPDLEPVTVASFENNSALRTVRVGLLDSTTCRVVFDLADEAVGVSEKTNSYNNLLTLNIGTGINTQSRADLPLEGFTLVLDAGHGGHDAGAQRGDVQEKDMTLAIINQLKKRLEKQGAHITMTRSDDTFVSLEDRVRVTNSVQPSAFVSVHINALESTSDIHGIETYYQTEQSKPLAQSIHQSLVTLLNVPDRGVRKARFYVINHTQVPAILAEVGYISNKDERDKLISSDYQAKVADALAEGVILYLGKHPETQENTAHAVHSPTLNENRHGDRKISSRTNKSGASSLAESSSSPAQRLK